MEKEILEELRSIKLMLAFSFIKDEEKLPGKVAILDRLELSNKEMAQICGTTIGSIKTTKQRLKNKK